MIARLHSAAVEGIRGYEVQVEVDARPVEDTGRMVVVGLPDAAVRESVQRVTSALTNSSFFRPGDVLVTVNLAPARRITGMCRRRSNAAYPPGWMPGVW